MVFFSPSPHPELLKTFERKKYISFNGIGSLTSFSGYQSNRRYWETEIDSKSDGELRKVRDKQAAS